MMWIHCRSVLVLGLLLLGAGCPCVPPPATPPATLEQLIDQQVGSLVENNVTAGAAVAVLRGGEVQTFFYGETAEGNTTPPDAHTEFEIGSVTKTFTGALLALLVAEGTVGLDDTLESFLPVGVNVPSFDGQEITLRHLATHTSALPSAPDDVPLGPLNDPFSKFSWQDVYDYLNRYQLTRAPGTEYDYSNLAIALLGHALERATGTPYRQLIHERLLTPLGLADSAFDLDEEQLTRFAAPHTTSLLGPYFCQPPQPAYRWNLGIFAAAGGLRSTLDDMVQYLRANLAARENALAPAADLLYAPQITLSPELQVAITWHRLRLENGHTVVWHNGQTGGYGAFFGFVPETGDGLVILSNTDTTAALDQAAVAIYESMGALP